MNWVFVILMAAGTLVAAFTGRMGAVTTGTIEAARGAVELAFSLIGQMALWLGLVRILEEAGLMAVLARWARPVSTRLFPGIPPDHPAMSAILLNVSANMLGLANAATPLGLKAMRSLKTLNRRPGVATDEMCMFLAINTSGVAVLPTGVIATRAAMASENATGIFLPSVLATMASTVVAVLAASFLARRRYFDARRAEAVLAERGATPSAAEAVASPASPPDEDGTASAAAAEPISAPKWRLLAALVFMLLLAAAGIREGHQLAQAQGGFVAVKAMSTNWILPLLAISMVMVGVARGVKVYEAVIGGAKESLNVFRLIVPYLVAILVAVGVFRSSGALEACVRALEPVTQLIGMPPEVLPMALVRPLSGSAALGVLGDLMKTHGPDSLIGFMASVMSGSTETTFYVLALYMGAAEVRITRHAVLACLSADLAGMLAAVGLSRIFW